MTLLLRPNSSRHPLHKSFLFDTHKFSPGNCLALSAGETDLGSNVPCPLDLLLPTGSGLHCTFFFLEISDAVGHLSLDKRLSTLELDE